MSTTPVEPTTTDPVTPQEPAAATPEPKPEPPKAPANPWDDPKAAQAEIERLRKENGAARTNAKAAAADEARKELAQQIGKALGLVADEPVDPAKLTEQLTATQAQAKQAALELAIFKASPDADVAKALLDSRSFLVKIANADPSDNEALAAAVGEWVAENPALGKRIPAPNPAQGTSANGAPGIAEQIAAAEKAGDVALAIRLKTQQFNV